MGAYLQAIWILDSENMQSESTRSDRMMVIHNTTESSGKRLMNNEVRLSAFDAVSRIVTFLMIRGVPSIIFRSGPGVYLTYIYITATIRGSMGAKGSDVL